MNDGSGAESPQDVDVVSSDYKVVVTFTFSAGVGAALKDNLAAKPATGFPPGGGTWVLAPRSHKSDLPVLELNLPLLQLDGLTPDQAATILTKRASDLADIGVALALAQRQLSLVITSWQADRC
jgi:hypothetical protein